MRISPLSLINALRWPRWLQNAVLVLLGVPAALWLGKFTILNPDLLLQLSIVMAILIPGFVMVSTDSSRLLPYVVSIWLIGPEIRRVTDWALGYYSPVTMLSLTPMLASSLLFLTFFKRPLQMDKPVTRVIKAYLIPLVFAACIGVLLNKLAGIYGVLNYGAPFLIAVYLAARPPSERQKDSWIRTYVTWGTLLSIYAWIQYLYLPPWDLLWMEGANMISLGIPEPMMFRAFSTLNAAGTLSVFLVSALIPAIMSGRWRGPFGWIGILLMISALAITLVRASWVTLIVGIVAYLLYASNVSRMRMIVTIAILTVIGMVVLPMLPGGDVMSDRVNSFGELEDDNSANVRWLIVLHTIPDLIANPIGAGLGGIGKSTALNGGEGAFSSLGSVDNGYLGVFATFGLLGGYLFFRAMVLHWKLLAGFDKKKLFRLLGLLTIVNLLVGFMFGGELAQFSAVSYWLFTGLALPAKETTANE